MANKLEDYIKKALKRGYSRTILLQQLLKAGYKEKEVTPLIEIIHEQLYPKDAAKKWHFAVAVLVVWIVIAVTLFFLATSEKTTCADKTCFFAAANACQDAQYTEDIEGTMMLYESKDCMLTKKISAFGPQEPEELQNLLKDKTIKCPYSKGQFTVTWMDTFGGLDTCTGTLKDVVYQLRLAQEE